MDIIEKFQKRKNKRAPKELVVKCAYFLTPNMRRITLQGDALSHFPAEAEGANVKLLFQQNSLGKPATAMRTYTIAQQRSAPNEIDIDFMLHRSKGGLVHGIAAPRALSAKPDDNISLFGPGLAQHVNIDADYFLLAADMTALPALKVSLKTLPKKAKGTVFVEILSNHDKQELPLPENIQVVWVINNEPGSDASPLYHAIKKTESQNGCLAAWVSCEFKTMKKIRNYLKTVRSIEKTHIYISSYWKKGDTEEQHKLIKKIDLASNRS